MAGNAHSDIVISPAIREDAPTVHLMLQRLATAHHHPDTIKSSADDILRHGFGASPDFEALIARRDGSAVGFAAFFYEFSTWRGCRGVYLQDLYVDEGLRGTGIGRRLLEAVIAKALTRDARYMRLAVHAANDDAMRFYRRLAFIEPEDRMFVLEGPDFAALGRG
jgi:GNAT superfamily N-acetyltransferase